MSRIARALAVVVAVASPAAAQPPSEPSPVIVTTGYSSLRHAPDQAWVSIAAEARAQTPADAQRLAADAMTSTQAALSSTGLPDEAIRTTGYSLLPEMENVGGRSRLIGYIARNQIEIRVDDLSRLSAVIDAAGRSGATTMSGLRFDIKDRGAIEREALRLAVQDALARARAVAEGAGATLGPIVRIDAQGSSAPPPMRGFMARAEMAQAATPINPGELDIDANVTLTVQIR